MLQRHVSCKTCEYIPEATSMTAGTDVGLAITSTGQKERLQTRECEATLNYLKHIMELNEWRAQVGKAFVICHYERRSQT
ncbi:hypothetical protein DD238_006573 [Peronospora effusa]|uniref:Uncharacterized protein n=1 Tax=Peronospora effusa TaxID=542832 RepID=A0A3M6VAY9_9STRA|nr:hypothetical protein DD238_006573 [Peronospora effusa]RQM12028.1 hypothetical protein DD237_006948 [Peronospora effusa]